MTAILEPYGVLQVRRERLPGSVRDRTEFIQIWCAGLLINCVVKRSRTLAFR